MSSAIDELYVILRATTAPLEAGFLTAGSAGERLAATMAAAMAEITASVDRMAANADRAGLSLDEMALQGQIDMDRLALSTQEASWKMEAATSKAAAANERLATSMDAPKAAAATAGPALAGIALAVAAVAAISVKMAGDFQSSTERLVTSAGETQAQLDGVRKGILAMAGQVGYSAMDMSTAMYTIESGGQHGAAGLQVLRAAAEGAKTENADLKTVADAVTSTLVDYHLKADDAATVTSKLVAATSQGKTTFQELSASFSQVLPVASAAHVSLNDILGDLASMTVHGMSAQQSAQNLSDVIRHMQNPTAVQAKEFALLGLTTNQVSDDLSRKGLSGTLGEITTRIRNFMPPGSQKVIMDLGNALGGLPQKVKDLGGRLLDGSISMKDYAKAAGELDPISAKQALSFATLAGSTHRIGDEQLTGQAVMQTYGSALAKATGDATGLRTALMLTGDNMGVTTNAIHVISGATTEAGNHVRGWHEIQGTFNQKMAEAKDGLGAFAITIGTALLPYATAFLGWLITSAQWIAHHHTVVALLASVLGGVLVVGLAMATGAAISFGLALLANPITWIVLGIGLLIFALYELVTHWKTVWTFIKEIAVDVWHWLVNVWQNIARDVSRWWNAEIAGTIIHAWEAIRNFFVAAWHWIADPIIAAWHWIANTTATVWGAISSFFTKWWPLLLAIFMPFVFIILALWHRFHSEIMDTVHAAWNAITGYLSGVWADIRSTAAAAWNLIRAYIINPIEAAWHWLVGAWDAVSSFLSGVWHTIAGAARAAWDGIRNAIVTPLEAAWHQVVSVASNIWHAITSALDNAYNAVANIGSRFASIGASIISGIVSGISGAAGSLFGSLRNLANSALSAAKSALGIGSPSRLFALEVGHWIPHGVAQGVTAAASAATTAVATMAGNLIGAAQLPALGGYHLTATTGGTGGATLRAASSSLTPGDGAPIVVQLVADGKTLFETIVPYAQQRKARNGTTGLT